MEAFSACFCGRKTVYKDCPWYTLDTDYCWYFRIWNHLDVNTRKLSSTRFSASFIISLDVRNIIFSRRRWGMVMPTCPLETRLKQEKRRINFMGRNGPNDIALPCCARLFQILKSFWQDAERIVILSFMVAGIPGEVSFFNHSWSKIPNESTLSKTVSANYSEQVCRPQFILASGWWLPGQLCSPHCMAT